MKLIVLAGLPFLLVASGVAWLFWEQNRNVDRLQQRVSQLEAVKATEYRPALPETLLPAAATDSLLPGFVARVFESGAATAESFQGPDDVGTFVIDSSSFSLAVYRDHAIELTGSPHYRLNALYHAGESGAHQFKLSLDYDRLAEDPRFIGFASAPECTARLYVDGVKLADSKVSFDKVGAGHLWGSAQLAAGYHATELDVHCDNDTATPDRDSMERSIHVRIATRAPSEPVAMPRGDAFWYRAGRDNPLTAGRAAAEISRAGNPRVAAR